MELGRMVGWGFGACCGLAVLLLVAAGILAGRRLAADRRRWAAERPAQDRALPALARERGWSYEPRDDRSLRIVDVFGRGRAEAPAGPAARPGNLKGRGDSGRAAYGYRFEMNPTSAAEHVMTFQEGPRRFVLFQHRWNVKQIERRDHGSRTAWREDRETARYASTVAVRLPGPTPFVCVTRRWKGAVDRLVGDDVVLEHQRFNREYFAFAEHPRFGHDVLHQGLIEWVLDQRPRSGDFLVVSGGWCFVSTEDLLRAEEADRRLRQVREFAALIPEHVWSVDYGLD